MCLSGINHFYQVPLHSIIKAEISIPNFPQEGCDMFLRKTNDEGCQWDPGFPRNLDFSDQMNPLGLCDLSEGGNGGLTLATLPKPHTVLKFPSCQSLGLPLSDI